MKVVYTQEAVRDLVDAYEYLIGRGELQAAQRIDTTVARLVERLARHEFEGPLTVLAEADHVLELCAVQRGTLRQSAQRVRESSTPANGVTRINRARALSPDLRARGTSPFTQGWRLPPPGHDADGPSVIRRATP